MAIGSIAEEFVRKLRQKWQELEGGWLGFSHCLGCLPSHLCALSMQLTGAVLDVFFFFFSLFVLALLLLLQFLFYFWLP